MADKAEILAAVEMANEGLGHEALIAIVASESNRRHVMVHGVPSYIINTADGHVIVTRDNGKLVVI